MQTAEPIRKILKTKGRELYSLPSEASVYDAVALMSERSAGALLVIDRGRLVGIISERDYARKVVLKGKSSRETPIREIMTSPVIRVDPNETVDECMRIMTAHRIRHLPVVENDQVTGIVSIGDLVKWLITQQQEKIQHLENFIAQSYPG